MPSPNEEQIAPRTGWAELPAAAWANDDAVAATPLATTPVRRHHRALLRLAAFAAFLAIAIIGVHSAITSGLRRIETSDFGVTNRIVGGRINADIVITGSSRALVHYDPRVIATRTGASTYNLGRNGSQTDLQVAVFKLYLRHNAKPKLVIHNLDLFTFTTSKEIYDAGQYVPYLNEEPIYAAIRRVYPDAWKWKYLPLYGYSAVDRRFTWLLGVRRLFGINPREDHQDGFVARSLSWNGDFERFAREHPEGFSTPVEAQGVSDFEELLALCRKERIPVLLVYSPEYAAVQRLETDRAAIFARFHDLAARYGATVWDFSDAPLCGDKTYFYNSQHLNAAGAARFSDALAQRLREHLGELTGGTAAR